MKSLKEPRLFDNVSPRAMTDAAAVAIWTGMPCKIRDDLDLLAFKPFDWDGKRGLPAREDVLRELRHKLIGPYGMDLRNLPRPDLELTRRGTIRLFFLLGRKGVGLEVVCSRVVRFVKMLDQDMIAEGWIELPSGTPATGYCAEIDEVTEWLLEK